MFIFYDVPFFQDGVKAASAATQQSVQSVVHRIYEHLVSGLSDCDLPVTMEDGARQRLLLLTIFALSVKYQPVDVSLAVNCGMLPLLSK